jgi:hypothetical protein
MYNTHMGTAREADIRGWLAKMNVTEEQAEAAHQLYLLGRGAKVRRGRVVNQLASTEHRPTVDRHLRFPKDSAST